MSSVILRRESLRLLLEDVPDLIEVFVDRNFNFYSETPAFYLYARNTPNVTHILRCLCKLFKSPRIYVSLLPYDSLFEEKMSLWKEGIGYVAENDSKVLF